MGVVARQVPATGQGSTRGNTSMAATGRRRDPGQIPRPATTKLHRKKRTTRKKRVMMRTTTCLRPPVQDQHLHIRGNHFADRSYTSVYKFFLFGHIYVHGFHIFRDVIFYQRCMRKVSSKLYHYKPFNTN